MLMTCSRCKNDFLTEADPFITVASSDGYTLYCLCGFIELKSENKHLTEIFDEAMKSASGYAENLCKANKENEMMREMISDWIGFEDDSIYHDSEYVWTKTNVLIKRARVILKKINENKKEIK